MKNKKVKFEDVVGRFKDINSMCEWFFKQGYLAGKKSKLYGQKEKIKK